MRTNRLRIQMVVPSTALCHQSRLCILQLQGTLVEPVCVCVCGCQLLLRCYSLLSVETSACDFYTRWFDTHFLLIFKKQLSSSQHCFLTWYPQYYLNFSSLWVTQTHKHLVFLLR